MKEHFCVSSCDGALYDARLANWHLKPLRTNYQFHHAAIRSVADFKATLRAGKYAWPGGYPLYLICDDGEALCFDCGHKNFRLHRDAIAHKERNGWRVVACDVNYEDNEMHCCNCGKQIESAYGD